MAPTSSPPTSKMTLSQSSTKADDTSAGRDRVSMPEQAKLGDTRRISTKAALETLSFFEGEKILVTPGMVELGDKQEEYNCEFGRNAAAVCDYVALVGERQTKSIYKGLVEASFDESRIFVSPSLGDALAKVGAIRTDKKKIVLLENDLPDNY